MRLAMIALSCALAVTALPLPGRTAATPFGFNDLPKIVRIASVAIAPDGRRIAFVVMRADMKKNAYANELDVADVATGVVRPLTHGRPHVGEPRWSPDGRELAFVDVVDNKPQVFVMPMDGGEPQAVTSAKNGVESYAWRPDGSAIAYVSEDDAPNAAAIKAHHDIFAVGDNSFVTTKAPVPSHVWLQPLRDGAADGSARRLTEGTWSVAGGLSWSADGSEIGFTRMPDAYTGHVGHASAAILDVATKTVHEVTPENGSSGVTFAPSGSAYVYQTGKDGLWAFFSQIVYADGGRSHVLAPSIDRDWQSAAWLHDGELVLGTFEGPRTGLWRVASNGAAKPIALGEVETMSASVSHDDAIAFAGSTPGDPSELYYLAPHATAPKRLTNLNAFLSERALGSSSELRWRNDGFEEDGIVTTPPGFDRRTRYPLVLVIHGGPTGNGSTLAFDPLVQMLAASGFVVFQPNYRGSDNMGFAYAKATRGDLDRGAGTDVVAGLHALEAQGYVDPARVGVSGWSAGGLMTSWLIGNYDLWKAAVTGAGVDDFVEEYDNEDSFDYMPALMGGESPWRGNGMALYRDHSPITYYRNVKAATLIFSDTSDFRVPTVQAYEFYHALRANGATVEFDAIPAFGHFPTDPIQQFDVFKRWTDWMTKYLK
jgi:dipeptidyl aminopeptidase/acylaminoacyl peptidase